MNSRTTLAVLNVGLFLLYGTVYSDENLQSTSNVIEQPAVDSRRILFLMKSGNVNQALDLYRAYHESTGKHDYDLLQQIGLSLLDQGSRKGDPETELMSIFGAGISANENALYILQDGLKSRYPQIQLVSLNFLSRLQDDSADAAVNHALGSPLLIIRLEALFHLASKKYPSAVGQAESLMCKVPEELWPLFPRLFGTIGTDPAIRILKKLMSHKDEVVRIASVLSAAEFGRDDLLPQIRMMAADVAPGQQEACATALGVLKDEASAGKLEYLTHSGITNVRLASLHALYKLGRKETKTPIEALAKQGDLFAINILGDMPGSEDVLAQLTQNDNVVIRVNASIALLKRRDPRCLPGIAEILVTDSRDLAFGKVSSQGHGLSAWKVIPSSSHQFEDNPMAYELSVHVREGILDQTLDLPEADFLKLAAYIFDKQQNDLVPNLVMCLQDLRTPATIQLLKKYQQKVGAPLIRNYCNLCLYRLKEEGPYSDILREWLRTKQSEDLIQFRPLLPLEMRESDNTYQITPRETSKLLVETFEAFAQGQDDKGVDALIDAIQYGNNKNRYALAGLLMRATQ